MDYYELLKSEEPPRQSRSNDRLVIALQEGTNRLSEGDEKTCLELLAKSKDSSLAIIESLLAYGFGVF